MQDCSLNHKPRISPLALLIAGSLLMYPWGAKAAPAAAPSVDPLGRTDPRSSVTGFLESAARRNYVRAEQFLDLRQLPAKTRDEKGVALAKRLEQILNSASHFNVLQLSHDPKGNLSDDSDPNLENLFEVKAGDSGSMLSLERTQLDPKGPLVWLFSSGTVAAIPKLTSVPTESAIDAIETHLPGFLVSYTILETSLWKWIALFGVAAIIVLLFRGLARLVPFGLSKIPQQAITGRWEWMEAIVQPVLVFLAALLFSIAQGIIDPSAVSRLYIGRAILLMVVLSFGWGLINLIELFLGRVDSLLDPRQRVVSHSLIYLARRASRVIIVVIAAITVLNNWGFNMTTIIAGLGVGGIAVALAAQQTIANVFGGVSVIGDHPVMIGDYGNFGGLLGTVEDIGMRSTRIRTLSRTIVSIPNSNFASMNLENFSLRDKILFNPALQIKRTISREQLAGCVAALEELLEKDKRIEAGPSPVRITGLTAASFGLEVFAYVLTSDINHFYKIEADLYVDINQSLTEHGVELV